MSTAAVGEGLYVAFEIAQQKELTRFVNDIPASIGEPLDYRSLTATTMYPEELANMGLGRHERRQMPSLIRKIQRSISSLNVVGSILEPNQQDLVAHKKFAAIAVDPSEELLEARKNISSIVRDELGVRVPSYNPKGWHVSVARRSRSGNRLAPYKKTPPKELVVSGMTIAIRSARGGDMRYVQDYVNVPRRSWR